MSEADMKTIEIRGFFSLYEVYRKKNWPMPLIIDLEEPTTGTELAKRLEISRDEVETIFVNGFLQDLEYPIKPGDRVAFMPPGGTYFLSKVTQFGDKFM